MRGRDVALLALLAAPATAQDSGRKTRVEDLPVGVRVELKVEPDALGTLRVVDAELAPPGDRDTVIGPLDRLTEDTIVVLGVVLRVDEGTRFLDAQDGSLPRERFASGSLVRADLSRGRMRATRVRLLTEPRRSTIAGRVVLSERHDEDTWRLVVLERELRSPPRLKVDAPPELASRTLSSLRIEPGGTRRGRRKDEDVTRGTIPLGDLGSLGGTLDEKAELRDDYTLDPDRDRDELRSTFRARIEAQLRPREDLLIVLGVKGEQDDRIRDERDDVHSFEARPDETFVQVEDLVFDGLDLLVGRSRFEDEREWLYNRNLDGVRLFFDGGPVFAEGSVTTGFDTGNRRDDHTLNLMGQVGVDLAEDVMASAWIVDRRDRTSRDESPFLFGLHSEGEPVRHLEYWIELAGASGVDGNRRIRGWAFDVGATYELDLPLDPAFTLGWAFGSGDRDPSDSVDGAFRQTGLQRNNGKLSGVTSFRYYGELVDPELSNLHVATAAVGVRLARRTSLDLVAHALLQDVAAASLRSSDLRATPNGRHRDLGVEIDAVLGIREWEALDLEVVAGWFEPGRAFDTNASAFTAKFQIRFKF